MARVTLDSRVRVPLAELTAEQADRIRAACTHANPNYGKPRHEGEPQSYRTWSHDDGCLTVPRGALERVKEILWRRSRVIPISPNGRDVDVHDVRTWSHPEPGFADHLKELRDYQRELVDAAVAGESGLLRSGTGSGKTTAAFGLLARLKRRSLVMVCSGALLKQWRDRAVEELGMDPEEVGHIQGDREVVRPLTLAMQQTMANRFTAGQSELARAFDVLVFDEVQRAPADTVFAAIDPVMARYRIGVSADESRKDGLEFFTRDLFGPVLAQVDEKRLIDQGAVVDVEVAVVPTKFEAPWYRYRQDFNKLLDQMTEDDDRNALILSLVRSAVSAGEQVIVFTHRVEHARLIDSRVAQLGIPGGLMLGGVENAEEFDRTKAKLKAGVLRCAVGTYAAIGEGIDVPAVARGIGATPMHNNRQKLGQVKGRVCRPAEGKERGKLAYLSDVSIYGRKPVENFVDWYKTVTVWDERTRRWVPGRDWLAQLRRGISPR